MKLTENSPELTAYALNQLDPEDRARVEAQLNESPELRVQVEAVCEISKVLEQALVMEPCPEVTASAVATEMAPAVPQEVDRGERDSGSIGWEGDGWRQWLMGGWQKWVGVSVVVGATCIAAAVFYRVYLGNSGAQEVRLARVVEPDPETEFSRARYARNEAEVSRRLGERSEGVSMIAETVVSESGPDPVAPVPADALRLGVPVPLSSAQPAPSSNPADASSIDFYQMEPVLARRYGLIPPSEVPAAPPAAPQPQVQSTGGERRLEESAQASDLGLGENRSGVDPASAGGHVGRVVVGSEVNYRFAESGAQVGLVTELARVPTLRESEALVPQLQRSRESKTSRGADRLLRSTASFAMGGANSRFVPLPENPFKRVESAPLSTFGLDVDTASYGIIRRFLREGSLPPVGAVRIEEMLQYFSYERLKSSGEHPVVVGVELGDCPWNRDHRIARVRVESPEPLSMERPTANLVFLVDVSGSMSPEDRLPLVQRSLRLLLESLGEGDSVGIVTYAGQASVALEPTSANEKERIRSAIDGMRSEGSTHGSQGIQRAYEMARSSFRPGGINRVVLCTDGDFNVGITDRTGLLTLIEEQARSGVFLTVLGYGLDNLQDGTAEMLADRGNGNYSYIDSFREAQKVLKKELQGSLVTVAKDVKLQIEFNPDRVSEWRLIGYENRLLADRDFNDDTKDAGEVGAGHQVTALYELIPVGGDGPGVDPLRYGAVKPAAAVRPVSRGGAGADPSNEWMHVKLRYKQPDGDTSRLLSVPVREASGELTSAASEDFRFATAVAGFGMLLRGSVYAGDLNYDRVLSLVETALGEDTEGYRAEFVDLVRKARELSVSGRR